MSFPRRRWTKAEVDTLRREYHAHLARGTTNQLAAALGRSSNSMYAKAFELGLCRDGVATDPLPFSDGEPDPIMLAAEVRRLGTRVKLLSGYLRTIASYSDEARELAGEDWERDLAVLLCGLAEQVLDQEGRPEVTG